MDQADRDLIIESRDRNMNFEREKHKDMKGIESAKLSIEKERLEMEKRTLMLKHDNMIIQKQAEQSKIVLLRLEIYQVRQKIKKDDPNVTEEYLDIKFPYP